VNRAWTPERARALDQLSGSDGVIVGAAVDHRDSLRTEIARRGLPEPGDRGLTALKIEIAAALAPAATVVLLDVEHGAAEAIAAGAIPGTVALAIPLEAQGYGDVADTPTTTFLSDWSAAKAARLGASACKLLLPYRSDVEEQSCAQDDVVRRAVAECRDAGIALILEPIVYPRPGEGRVPADALAELVVAGAERLAALEPDVLKLQYPGSPEACAALDRACGPLVPWVLLGGGADAGVLERQIEDACRAGASGFIVGRTLWDAALVTDAHVRGTALEERCRPLLERLATLARAHATPWRERVGSLASPVAGWYR
jgi:tagatose 1,6-diphosphate aldolase